MCPPPTPSSFRGEAAEPRPGLRSGHIPGSRSLQFADVLRAGRWAAWAGLLMVGLEGWWLPRSGQHLHRCA